MQVWHYAASLNKSSENLRHSQPRIARNDRSEIQNRKVNKMRSIRLDQF